MCKYERCIPYFNQQKNSYMVILPLYHVGIPYKLFRLHLNLLAEVSINKRIKFAIHYSAYVP